MRHPAAALAIAALATGLGTDLAATASAHAAEIDALVSTAVKASKGLGL